MGLKKTDNNIWFCNGWQDFVEYHSICYVYFLVFRYEGISSFHVLIFDKTAIEIQYPPKKNCKLEDHQVKIIEKFVLKKLPIMSKGRERAIQAAKKFKPKNPSFMGISWPHNMVSIYT